MILEQLIELEDKVRAAMHSLYRVHAHLAVTMHGLEAEPLGGADDERPSDS